MPLKNTEESYTLRLGGAWINRKPYILINIYTDYGYKYNASCKSNNTYGSVYKSFRICKLQRN